MTRVQKEACRKAQLPGYHPYDFFSGAKYAMQLKAGVVVCAAINYRSAEADLLGAARAIGTEEICPRENYVDNGAELGK